MQPHQVCGRRLAEHVQLCPGSDAGGLTDAELPTEGQQQVQGIPSPERQASPATVFGAVPLPGASPPPIRPPRLQQFCILLCSKTRRTCRTSGDSSQHPPGKTGTEATLAPGSAAGIRLDRCRANSKIGQGAKIGVLAKKLTTDPPRLSCVSGVHDSSQDPENRVARRDY